MLYDSLKYVEANGPSLMTASVPFNGGYYFILLSHLFPLLALAKSLIFFFFFSFGLAKARNDIYTPQLQLVVFVMQSWKEQFITQRPQASLSYADQNHMLLTQAVRHVTDDMHCFGAWF